MTYACHDLYTRSILETNAIYWWDSVPAGREAWHTGVIERAARRQCGRLQWLCISITPHLDLLWHLSYFRDPVGRMGKAFDRVEYDTHTSYKVYKACLGHWGELMPDPGHGKMGMKT